MRQISWLRDLGFNQVVTIGKGNKPPGVDRHYRIPEMNLPARLVGYLMRSHPSRFEYFFGRYLQKVEPGELNGLDLLVVNEVEYLSWPALRVDDVSAVPTFLDIHEDHLDSRARTRFESFLFTSFWKYEWIQTHKFVDSRRGGLAIATVGKSLAERYSKDLGATVQVILNAPPFEEFTTPAPTAGLIKMVHHGFGTRARGIEEAILSLRHLPQNYTLDLIIFSSAIFRLRIKLLAAMLGVFSRVRILAPVAHSELVKTLSAYDVAVILLPPVTQGNLFSMPNKFFESVHAGLAIAIGPNPDMRGLVQENDMGIVISDWSGRELARKLALTSQERIGQLKSGARHAAAKLSEQNSKERFLQMLRDIVG